MNESVIGKIIVALCVIRHVDKPALHLALKRVKIWMQTFTQNLNKISFNAINLRLYQLQHCCVNIVVCYDGSFSIKRLRYVDHSSRCLI